jgi:hypothetical protein
MKKVFCLIPLAVLLSGCAFPTWSPYSGVQKDWPTSDGAFTSPGTAIPVFDGLPPKPYTVLGRLDIWTANALVNLRQRAASAAKSQGADAVLIDREGSFVAGMVSLNSRTTVPTKGGGTATFTSSTAVPDMRFQLSVVAIKWK